MPRKSRPYEIGLRKRLMNPSHAISYVKAAAEDSQEGFLLALRDLAEVTKGMSKVAEAADKNRENLYRMLSEDGNPRLDSLWAVLEAMGLRLTVEPIIENVAAIVPAEEESAIVDFILPTELTAIASAVIDSIPPTELTAAASAVDSIPLTELVSKLYSAFAESQVGFSLQMPDWEFPGLAMSACAMQNYTVPAAGNMTHQEEAVLTASGNNSNPSSTLIPYQLLAGTATGMSNRHG